LLICYTPAGLVIASTHRFIKGTTVNPVGIDKQQPTKKSAIQIVKKSVRQPTRKSNMPKLITAVMAIETNSTNKTVPCFGESFITTREKVWRD